MRTPLATAGSWLDWIHVFLMMRRPAALVADSHMSSVSITVVSLLLEAFAHEFGDMWRRRCSQGSPQMFIWVDDVIASTGPLKDLHRVNRF